eukprot:TRINITY_DN14621_c0_g1_i3.p1 TRINITY_DN14621_c0_g1~~TRINITY_DN14621_c0_g1_i3.p1  ORF type:complete len:142 (-),score=40.06 TRINITY_DN14621_c0_g1_i3:150-575(-)
MVLRFFSAINRVHFPVINSTNTWVKQNSQQLCSHPTTLTAVSTDEQTAGRGTKDRKWEAAPGASILLTLFFSVPRDTQHIPMLTSVLALSVVEAVRAMAHQLDQHLECCIKWPNDVICNNRKIGGIPVSYTHLTLPTKRIV